MATDQQLTPLHDQTTTGLTLSVTWRAIIVAIIFTFIANEGYTTVRPRLHKRRSNKADVVEVCDGAWGVGRVQYHEHNALS